MSSPAAAATDTTPTTPDSGPPLDPDSYDYSGAVLWQAHAGPSGPGSPPPCAAPWPPRSDGARDLPDHARLSYAKVAEYQRRGLVHFHAVIRLDGPDGPTDAPPPGLGHDAFVMRSPPPRATHSSRRRGPTEPVWCSSGRPARPPPGHPHRLPAPRGQRRGDHRRRTRPLHRQVRHQIHRCRGPGRGRRPADPRRRPHRLPRRLPAPPTDDRHRLAARRAPSVRSR